jgi:serine-type D-Ala-D-Ala carboxypeptidase/endopeptidase (penicillin-binding protein 4)
MVWICAATAALVTAAPVPASTPSPTPLAGSGIAAKLDKLIARAPAASGAWVYDPQRSADPLLFAEDAGKARILASNEKLFTTATALDRLGADGRLRTTVWADGAVAQGTLAGNLYLVGDGDPALATADFAQRNDLPLTDIADLAQAIEDAGTERVTGKLFVDDTVFDRRRGIGKDASNVSQYIGPLSGLSFNSGLSGDGFSAAPELDAGEALKDELEAHGVEVAGGVERGEVPAPLQAGEPLAAVSSDPLGVLVDETNETSNNFFAEMLLKRLAATTGQQGTTKGGATIVRAFARGLGARVRARDGSGLGRGNRAPPARVGRLLVEMLEHPAADAFFESLPRAGVEGTLAGRMEGTAAEGRCRAKTGTLTGVSALSGYCDIGGEPVAFSILMNGVGNVTAARSIQDRMVKVIARYRR